MVGQRTFGKGLVQSVRSLSDGSGLTVTVAKYLTPSGKDINKNGIEPNFQAEDGIRDFCLSRGLGDVYKRQNIRLYSIFINIFSTRC